MKDPYKEALAERKFTKQEVINIARYAYNIHQVAYDESAIDMIERHIDNLPSPSVQVSEGDHFDRFVDRVQKKVDEAKGVESGTPTRKEWPSSDEIEIAANYQYEDHSKKMVFMHGAEWLRNHMEGK